jgi:hypothetical protein
MRFEITILKSYIMRQPIMPWFTINFNGDWTSENAAQCNRLIHVTLVTTNFMNA